MQYPVIRAVVSFIKRSYLNFSSNLNFKKSAFPSEKITASFIGTLRRNHVCNIPDILLELLSNLKIVQFVSDSVKILVTKTILGSNSVVLNSSPIFIHQCMKIIRSKSLV